jgi:S1-C subfamily serine protease
MQRIVHFAIAIVVVVLGGSVAMAGGEHCQQALDQTAAHLSAKGWLGIETEKDAGGAYRVTAVAPGSPAAEAGFAVGDVLVALNGVALRADNKEAVMKAKKELGVGKTATYTVARAGAERRLTATLAPVPRDVLAKWLGEHVIDEHLGTTVAQAN